MQSYQKKILLHSGIFLIFGIISLLFFYPVLQGKKIQQNDIVQYIGMAKERNDFRENEKKESYWTNSAFGGMPTYQLGAEYAHNYVKKIDKVIRFLPRPADYLFLYFVGIYIFLCTLKIPKRYSFLGALAFGFSTYLIIILGVGHNAKAHAIGYFGFVLTGILLAFQRKYIWGFLVTTLAFALEINANHYQMTYYLLFLIGIFFLVEMYKSFREKEMKSYWKSAILVSFSVFFALLLNATNLLATREYAAFSTRGKSTLTINPDGTPKKSLDGLSKDYITEYSYGISESFNLIVPRLFGGANNENLGRKSHTYTFLIANGVPDNQALMFSENLPTYWGDQPIVAAPAYIGILVFFFFVLSFFIVENKHKYWLIGGVFLSLVLSWGKNFPILTDFMIDYFPLYNKFRAISSIQVILEFCLPVLAVISLYQLVENFRNGAFEKVKKSLIYTSAIVSSLLLLLLLVKGSLSFQGISDDFYARRYGSELLAVIKEDRKQLYSDDIYRAFLFLFPAISALFLFLYRKISEKWLLSILSLLFLVDLVDVSRRYVDEKYFVDARIAEKPFILSENEQKILSDTTHFRVFNVNEGLNGARTSYFFKSIGGYHAAKPLRIQELFDYQIYKNNNIQILNSLNVKYFIQRDENGEEQVSLNKDALGNAWFVSSLKNATAQEIMPILDTLNPSKSAVYQELLAKNHLDTKFVVDSTSKIQLKSYKPDRLVYISENQHNGYAVFSEIYYRNGWKATIDGRETRIYPTNYALRGIQIPAGKHEIIFEFQPEIVKIGEKITLSSTVFFIIIIFGCIFWKFRAQKKILE